VRSSCSSDINFPKSYTWAHQWNEDDFDYLIYQPRRSQSSETSGICLSIQTFKSERKSNLQIKNDPSHYRIHKLDVNCDVVPSSDVKKDTKSHTQKSSWSNYYSSYEETTTSPDLPSEATNEFVLILKGDCSQVSSAAGKISFLQASYLFGEFVLLILTYTIQERQ
jgi:hypothetical protein